MTVEGPPHLGRAPAATLGRAPRHPAANHPGFEPHEAPTTVPIAQVLAAVNAGFQRLGELLALERELGALRDRVSTHAHDLEIERLQRAKLEERVKELEKDVEDTGQHRQKDIEKELERMRGSQAHWVRYVIGAVVAAVVTLLMTVLARRV